MKNMSSQEPYRAGYYYELIEDVGPIPKGIYKLSDVEDEFVVLGAGKKVTFSIAGEWKQYVKPTSQRRASLTRTSADRFLDRYYELMRLISARPEALNPSKTFTMCFVDPSLAREVH